MPSSGQRPERPWSAKFADAFRGIRDGVKGQASFAVHAGVAAAVVVAGSWFRVSTSEWCILLLCITSVLVTEMLNSGLEQLAKAVDSRPNPHVGQALDIASGAVLVAAFGTSCVGGIVFLPRLLALL